MIFLVLSIDIFFTLFFKVIAENSMLLCFFFFHFNYMFHIQKKKIIEIKLIFILVVSTPIMLNLFICYNSF